MTEQERSPFARPVDEPYAEPARPARAAEPLPQPETDPVVDDLPPVERPRSRAGVWVALVVALAVLATIAAFVVRALITPKATPAGPQEVAVRYLNAIAAADIATAQAQSAIQVTSPSFTPESLRASQQAAPITEVRAEALNGQDVVLAYKLGGKDVRGTFPMVHVAEGWKVKRPTVRTRIAPSPQMIRVELDKQPLTGQAYTYDVELAPGQHRLSVAEGAFVEFQQPEVVVTGLTDNPQVNAKTQTTKAYPAELKKRLQDRVNQCLAAKELAPKGCPWAFRAAAGETVDPASITYKMDGNPFAAFNAPALGTADAIARGEVRFTIKVNGKVRTAGGRAGTISDEKLVIGKYEADLADPQLPFIWAS